MNAQEFDTYYTATKKHVDSQCPKDKPYLITGRGCVSDVELGVHVSGATPVTSPSSPECQSSSDCPSECLGNFVTQRGCNGGTCVQLGSTDCAAYGSTCVYTGQEATCSSSAQCRSDSDCGASTCSGNKAITPHCGSNNMCEAVTYDCVDLGFNKCSQGNCA